MKFNRPARVSLRCGCLALALALMPADGPWAEKLPLDFYGIDLHGDDERVTTSGGLTWRGGLRISSDDPRFGGLSALRVEQDGRRLVALTDKGRWITARLSYDEAGHLDGISDGEIGPLRSPDGKSVAGTEDGDSESLARYRGGTVVAFEGPHRLWSYNGPPPAFSHLPTRLPRLPTLTRAHRNRGIEALTTLSDGRLFALAEDLPTASGDLHGWVTDQGVWRSLTYARTGQFLPTGAATLPGGGVLVLERCFTWAGGFATRILRIGAAAIQPGRRLDGNELVELSPPLVSDNFEGISVRRGKNSAMLIYLISDDNFNILQQSLLVMFALTP